MKCPTKSVAAALAAAFSTFAAYAANSFDNPDVGQPARFRLWTNNAGYNADASRSVFSYGAPRLAPEPAGIGVGFSQRIGEMFSGGVNFASVRTKHDVFGGAYEPNALANLGDGYGTLSLGFTAAVNFNLSNSLVFESTYARSSAVAGNTALAGSMRGYGVSFMSRRVWLDSDRLMLSARQPLRIGFGQLGLLMPSVDEPGIPYATEGTSLVPSAREMDYRFSYETALRKNQSLNFQSGYRRDVFNIPGNNDAYFGSSWRTRF